MTDILSAEKATKFLRSKENVSQIISTANDILDNKLDIYLPQRELFILTLLVDRLNDRSNSKFSNWKYQYCVWDLLITVWHKCPESHRKSIQHLKIIDIVCNVLEKGDTNVIESALTGLELVYRESYVDIDENSTYALLKSYVTATTGKDSAKWDKLVYDIYIRISMKSTREVSKKNYTKFFQECCPSILSYLTHSNASPIFQEILVREIFNKELIEHLNNNIETLLKQSLDDSSITLFYKLIVEQLSSKHMEICQQAYSTIISKYNHLAESLLCLLSTSQKTLTHEFAESVYSAEVDSKDFSKINWNMIKYLFTLDNDLAVEKSSFIFENYNSNLNLPIFEVGKSIVIAYVNNRELTEFIILVWPQAIKSDSIWKCQEFVEFVSSKIDTFTSKQLVHVIEECYKLDELFQQPIFTAITTGLISCPFQIIESVKEKFIQKTEFFNKSNDFWHIRFNLLCLYGTSYNIPKKIMKPVNAKYYYFTLFRLLELENLNTVSDAEQQAFLKLLKGNKDLSYAIIKRWLVVLNNFLDQGTLVKILGLVLEKVDVTQLNHVFFEQRKLTTALLKLIMNDLPNNMSILQSIPIQCISRTIKKDLMNQLFDLFKNDINTLDIIKHLLSQPSYQSDLELDFENLIKLVESRKPTAFDIAEIIWTNHIQQIKDNEDYIINVIEYMTKYLKKEGFEVSGELELCLIMFSNQLPEQLHSQFNSLKQIFITKCLSNLESINESTVVWNLQALIKVKSEINYSKIWSNLQKLNVQSNEMKSILFQLISHTISVDFKHSIYVLALFVALHSQGVTVDLELYMNRLSQEKEVYLQVFDYFTNSIDETNDCYVIIACHLLTHSSKDTHSNVSIAKCLTLFIDAIKQNNSIGLILETLKTCLVDHTWIFNQYLLEKTLVIIAYMTQTTIPELYILSTQVTSHILLYHRFKLSTRHHIILKIATELLRLCYGESPIAKSTDCASAYSRLLTNLCEPSQRTYSDQAKLTTTANLFKRALRKHLPVLLINYIYFNLKFQFVKQINDELVTGIYSIFDVLSPSELTLVNASLDNPGKSFYKTLYNDYKEYGKWKDQ